MAIENLQSMIDEIVKNGITLSVYSYIYITTITLLSAGFGAYLGAYFKKRGEERALIDSFNDIKDRLRKTTLMTEEIKASVSINTIEHQIKFNKLHEKRIEVIENLYHRLVIIEQSAQSFICSAGPTQDPKNEFQKVSNAISEFINYSRLNKFWVEKDLFEQIEEVALKIDKIVQNSLFCCNISHHNQDEFAEAMDKNKQYIQEITEKIPEAKEKIIDSIRKALNPKET